MNKKLLCLILSILMLLTCLLTSCSTNKEPEEDDEATVDNSAKTITMWVIAEDPVVEIKDGETEAQALARAKEEQKKAQDAVQAKFSAMTKAKFKTDVVLRFCSEAEYYAKLEAAIEKNEAEIALQDEYNRAVRSYISAQQKTDAGKGKDKKELTLEFHALPENAKYSHLNPYDPNNNINLDDEDGPTEDIYTENEDGVAEILYPKAEDDQVDIFYIGNVTEANGKKISGYTKYMQYIDNEWLASLNESLSTASKKLESYISTSLLKGVEVDGIKYAIPNNVAIGEYTYMFIDKELFDNYYHKIDSVSSLTDLSLFLSDIMYENTGKLPTDDDYIVPLAATFEDCIKLQSWYWDLDYKDISVYETYFDSETGRNYVLQTSYEMSTGDKENPTIQTALIDTAVEGQLYRVDDEGRFLDKDGNVLPYTYAVETEFYWTLDKNGTPKKVAAPNSRTLYLVDGDGNPVTPANDKRVIEDGETEADAYGNVRPTYLYFINQDADFSILGAMIEDPELFNRGSISLDFTSLFTNKEYRDLYATLKDYEYKGYYGTPTETQNSAISFVKGDAKILKDYEAVMDKVAKGDSLAEYTYNGRAYYVLVAEYPMATEDELYGNMFAVYENSPYLSRAMKVLTYLNTNSEMRNLLQYGIENFHYELNDDGTVHLLSGDRTYGTYRMKLERTGNCFIATPTEDKGIDAWTYAKIQNNDSQIHPLLGFDFNTVAAESSYGIDVQLIDYIKRLNAEAAERINDCESKEELVMLMTAEDTGFANIYTAEGADNKEKMKKALNFSYDPSAVPNGATTKIDPSGNSPYTLYYTWMTDYKYLPS